MSKYIPPSFQSTKFHCPHCQVFAAQSWHETGKRFYGNYRQFISYISICAHCDKESVWVNETMIYPDSSVTEYPHEDMPDDCKRVFEEARSVFSKSPKSASALLRLCIQMLMPHLGMKGKDINEDIGKLVEKGLPTQIQQALDVCRVVGNNGVHPGDIDLDEDPQIALSLFALINGIIENRIAEPKRIQAMFDNLPQNARSSIEKRDAST